MTVDRKTTMELFRRLKKYHEEYGLVWCTAHGLMAQTVDKEMVKLMAESGAYQITIAIESGSDRVLKEIIHKPVPSKEKVKEVISECHKYDIQVHGLFVIGLPGETKEEIMETIDYPYEVDFDSVTYFIANPIIGSELYNICKKKGYLVKNAKIDQKTAEINIPKSSPDYVMSRKELTKLADDKTREYNKHTRKKYPEKWDAKYRLFLKKHSEESEAIEGRVT